MEVTKIFTFDAAHFLTDYHGKCEYLHGHTYKLEVTVEGEVSENGLVLDFILLKSIVQNRVLSYLDHKNLNEILDNPSSENLIIWIWNQLTPFMEHLKEEVKNPNFPRKLKAYVKDSENIKVDVLPVCLKRLRLWETQSSYVTYEGV